MDAIRQCRWACSLGLLCLCGCMLDNTYPATSPRGDNLPQERREPPQVVETEPPAESETADEEEVLDAVIEYIQQVDDVQTRASQRKSWQPHDDVVARQVANEDPNVPDPLPPAIPMPDDPNSDAAHFQPEPGQPLPAPTSSQPAVAPPELGAVTVRAASDLRAVPGETAAPAVNTAAIARFAGPTSLREFLEHSPPTENPSFREQVDRRMLWVVAGDYERARQPLRFATNEQQQLAARFIDAWIAVREGHMGDEGAAATAAAQALASLQDALRQLSDLRIPTVRICSAVRSFGQYDPVEPPRFYAGLAGEFVLYCELADFVSEHREDGDYYTVFDMTTTILNRAGDVVLKLEDSEIVDRCRNRRQDCFIPRLVRLPAALSPGRYVAKVTIADKLGEKVAENSTTFELVARP